MRRPTYQVVGKIERFDERDTVFAREALVPGSWDEVRYHEMHPHLKAVDDELSRFINEKLDKSEPTWGRTYYQTVFASLAHLGLPDCVDGTPALGEMNLTATEAARLVKSVALYLGADAVGIGPLRQEWVYSHKGSRPYFESQDPNPPLFEGMPEDYAGRRWGDPIEITHPRAVALGFAQDLEVLRSGPGHASDLEIGKIYARSALVACQVSSFIRSLGWSARAHHVRNYGVLVVPVAVDAGLGELARSGYLLNGLHGLNLRLSAVTTDMPLDLDEPVDIGVQEFCERCLKCARCCPVAAIPDGPRAEANGVLRWKMDAEKCLQYWSRVGAACVICQLVCPWTKRLTWYHRAIARLAARYPGLARMLVFGDDLFYGKQYRARAKPEWMV